MKALQTMILVVAPAIAASAEAADAPTAKGSFTARSLATSRDRFMVMQLEYCLRNAPELTEELVRAHAIYSQASGWAAEILTQKYPAPVATRGVSVSDGKNPRSQTLQLRLIQSQGISKCPMLVREMETSNGQSLARELSREFENLVNANYLSR